MPSLKFWGKKRESVYSPISVPGWDAIEPEPNHYPSDMGTETNQAPVTGVRVYTCIAGQDYVLRGSYGAYWPSRDLVAACTLGNRRAVRDAQLDNTARARQHLINDSFFDCSCGIYASTNPGYNLDYSSWPTVAAVVTGWGAVVIGEAGWRAERCRIEQLYFNTNCAICLKPIDQGFFASGYYFCPDDIRKGLLVQGRTKVTNSKVVAKKLHQRYGVPVLIGSPWDKYKDIDVSNVDISLKDDTPDVHGV